MKQITRIMFFGLLVGLVTSASAGTSQPDKNGIISGGGWNFSKSDLRPYPWTPPIEQMKKSGRFLRLRGWIEYEFETPASGWYSLWLAGIGESHNRDVFVDGKALTLSSFSMAADYEYPDKQRRARGMFMECNLFLKRGKHVIRLNNDKFPGNLPNRWELRPAGNHPEAMVRATYEGNPLMEPGSRVKVKLSGGGAVPTEYELFLRDFYTDTDTPVGKLSFKSSKAPVSKTLDLSFPGPGIYLLMAKANGKVLRPSTFKTCPFVVYKDPKKQRQSASLPKKLELMAMFTDNAVLQREKPVPVWGWAAPDSEVTVSISGQTKKGKANSKGEWRVTLDPMKAGGPHILQATDGKTSVTAQKVLIGDVWLFAGQSNMGAPMLHTTNGPEAGRKANWPQVRQTILMNRNPDGKSQHKLWFRDSGAYVYDPKRGDKSIGFINAIAYAFCTRVHQETGVPVAAILNNRGGTAITTWTSLDTQRRTPAFQKTLDDYQAAVNNFTTEKKAAKTAFWAMLKPKKKNDKEGSKPSILKSFGKTFIHANKGVPELHYNALVKPFAPFAIRGVCWYQGESDGGHAYRYRKMFPAMIGNWREIWQDPKLPFIYAQIAGVEKSKDGAAPPATSAYAEQCEAQAMCMKTASNTMMVCTYDLPTPKDNIHYLNKLPVGARMAQAALATVYGKDIVPTGPIYKFMKVEGGKVRVAFDYVGKGLIAKRGELKGFSIAGADKQWVWAQAKIDPANNTVIVWSDKVKSPVAVRYNWNAVPQTANLYNKSGLPASIFRSDDWPGETENN